MKKPFLERYELVIVTNAIPYGIFGYALGSTVLPSICALIMGVYCCYWIKTEIISTARV